jgi:hypothetical protein
VLGRLAPPESLCHAAENLAQKVATVEFVVGVVSVQRVEDGLAFRAHVFLFLLANISGEVVGFQIKTGGFNTFVFFMPNAKPLSRFCPLFLAGF